MLKVKDHRKVFMEGCWLWLPMPWLRYLDIIFYLDSTYNSIEEEHCFFSPPFKCFCMISLDLCYDTQGANKREPKDLWQEPFVPASAWRPCADQRSWEPSGDSLSLYPSACVCVCV